jgi:hypothetical protein
VAEEEIEKIVPIVPIVTIDYRYELPARDDQALS